MSWGSLEAMRHPMHRQRQRLCDLLESLTPAQFTAETLCEGWDAGHIAAHLLVREREPLPAVGIVVPPLSGMHDSRVAARREDGQARLVSDLRDGPPVWMRLPIARDIQVTEDWIHGQDVARGGAAEVEGTRLSPDDGTADPDVAARLWKGISRYAPLTLRGVDVGGVVDLTDGQTHRTFKVGGQVARPAPGSPADATVSGPVGELILYAVGRDAAEVAFDGREDLVAALQGADRGV